MVLQRFVIIITTAFSGAWTMILGAAAMAGYRVAERAAAGAAANNVWILYPFTPAPGLRWVPIAWFLLGGFGAAMQFGITGRKKF
jgi:hypothetical protein